MCLGPRLVLALLVGACAVFPVTRAGALDVPKPSARIRRFDIDSIGLREINFLFDISIRNPYPIDLFLDAVKLRFLVENNQAFQTQTGKGFKVRALGEQSTVFIVNLKYEDVIKVVKDYGQKDVLDTVAATEIVVPLPRIEGLPPSISFKHNLKQRIPAIKPRISIVNFTVQPPSVDEVSAALRKAGRAAVDKDRALSIISGALAGKSPEAGFNPHDIDLPLKVGFDIELVNETKARLDFTGVDYTFFVNGTRLLVGRTTDTRTEAGKSVVRVANTFSTRALAGPVLDAFRRRTGTFGLQGETRLKFPDEIKKDPVKLVFDETGSFRLR